MPPAANKDVALLFAEEVATQPQPQLEVSKIDLRVGRILSVDSHPEADE